MLKINKKRLRYQKGVASLVVVIVLVSLALLATLVLLKSGSIEYKKEHINDDLLNLTAHLKEDAKLELPYFCSNRIAIAGNITSSTDGKWTTSYRNTNGVTGKSLEVPYQAIYSNTSNSNIVKMQIIAKTSSGSTHSNSQFIYAVLGSGKAKDIVPVTTYKNIEFEKKNYTVGNSVGYYAMKAGSSIDTGGGAFNYEIYGTNTNGTKATGSGVRSSNDAAIKGNANTDDFFSSIFGATKQEVKDVAGYKAGGMDYINEFYSPAHERLVPASKNGGIMWVEGDIYFGGDIGSFSLGTPDKPILLISTGKIIWGNINHVSVYGVMYAEEGMELGGAIDVKGALISGGKIHLTGVKEKNIVYSLKYGALIDTLPRAVSGCLMLPGSWIDYD